MADDEKLAVVIMPECKSMLRELEIPEDWVATTINNRDRGVLDSGCSRMIAVHWFTDERILFVESTITKRRIDKKLQRMHFNEVTVPVAIELRPSLPGGPVTRKMTAEEILGVVARSFGVPVTCHPEHLRVPLYNGQWNGLTVVAGQSRPLSGAACICGTFDSEARTAQWVWAFDREKYRKWFLSI